MITLTLPYPISANRYWTSFYATKLKRVIVGPSKEATAYRREVARIAAMAGVFEPIAGRVAISVTLYPHRPLDWVKRMQRDPIGWDDTVQCLDLDNVNKVLLDSLKGVVIEDDKWVRSLTSERVEPDCEPARVIVTIRSVGAPRLQPDLLGEQSITDAREQAKVPF